MFRLTSGGRTERGIWRHSISKVAPTSTTVPFANLVRFPGGRPTFARNSSIPVATPLRCTLWLSVTVVCLFILRV